MAKPVYALVNGAWVLVGSTTAHNHTITDITGLQAALDAKANAADVTTALADKADIASPTFTGTLTADTVKITGGVPGAGKVLTSDADGDATWEAPAASGIQPTLFDAKGDILVASAADTAARLAAGTDGQVLTADSAEGTGLKWVSLPSTPTGVTVVQVLEAQASIWTADVQTNVTAAVDDVIAVYAVWEGAASPTYSIASPGLTFTQQAMTGVATTGIGLWTAPVTSASTYTVTGSISANDGGTTHSIQVALIRGANPSNPMDVTPILGTVSGTSWSLGSITTTNSSMIIAAAAGYGTVDAITGPSGWTNNDLQQGLTHTRMLSYKGQTNAGASESITMTIGYSQAGRYILAAFRPAGVYDPITEGFIDAKGDLIAGTAADTAARLPAGTDGQILSVDSVESTGLKWVDSPAGSTIGQFMFSRPGTVAVVTGVGRMYNPRAVDLTFLSARASVNTAPTGASILISIIKNGATTIGTLTITAGSYTSGRQAFTETIADGDYLTINITQAGSTIPGSDLVVQLEYS